MKTRNKIILLLALALTCMITSCESYLDTMPDQRTELNSVRKVKDLLMSAYSTASSIQMEEFMSDNRMDNGEKYGFPSNILMQGYYWEEMTDINQDTPRYLWNGCYSAIAAANQALQAIEELGDPEEAQPYKGEALMCRAYGHFALAKIFCMAYGDDADTNLGIPYITAPETNVGVQYERGTLAETYAMIDKDIEEGLPLISSEAYDIPLYHFNQNAAYAFAAQFNLFYNKFDKAIRYATEAIGEDPSSVLRNMGGYAQFPSSMEYTLAYISSDEPANLMLQQTMSWWGSNYKSAYRYGHSREICEKQTIWSKGPYGSLKVYETVLGYGDQSIFVPKMEQQTMSWWGSNYKSAYRYGHSREICEKQTIWSKGPYGSLKVYETVLGYGDQSIFVPKMDQFKEIANAITGSYYGRQVAFAFTTDKTLLNRAEAYVLSKQYDKAVNDLQYWYRIKAATKVPDKDELNLFYETVDPTTNGKPLDPKFALEAGLQTNLLKAVIHARRIETVHEGERWQDIKRFGIEISHNIENESPIVLKAHDLRKAVQIPASVVEAGMQPNPR